MSRLARAALALVLVGGWQSPMSPAAATAEVCVAVVVDYGTEAGAPSGPNKFCADVPAGSTGADVLDIRAARLRRPPPRYDASGLLCAIDGYPKTGCGETTPNGYRYWSYWHGSSSGWSFSNRGPAGYTVPDRGVEGWRFAEGSGGGGDSQPRSPSSYDALCPAPGPPPSTAPARPTRSSATTAAARPSPTSRAPAPPARRPGAQPSAASATSASSPPPAVRSARPSATASQPPAVAEATTAPPVEALAPPPAEALPAPPDDDGGGPPLGTIVGALAVLGLAGAAIWRSRRSPAA